MNKILISIYENGNFDLFKKMILAFGFLGLLIMFISTLQSIGVYQIVGDGTLRASIVMSFAGFLTGYLSVIVYDELGRFERVVRGVEGSKKQKL